MHSGPWAGVDGALNWPPVRAKRALAFRWGRQVLDIPVQMHLIRIYASIYMNHILTLQM